MAHKYFISGIDTGIGKTLISAILVNKLQADYWKPIQSGDLDNSDTMKVKALVSNKRTRFHPETYALTQPLSPHASAEIDGVHISLNNLTLPDTDNNLIVEGAGGLMVPLNDKDLIIDMAAKLMLPVVLVANTYLGSINHTLLSVYALQHRHIPIAGIIFSGQVNTNSVNYILNYTEVKHIGTVPQLGEINPKTVEEAGALLSF